MRTRCSNDMPTDRDCGHAWLRHVYQLESSTPRSWHVTPAGRCNPTCRYYHNRSRQDCTEVLHCTQSLQQGRQTLRVRPEFYCTLQNIGLTPLQTLTSTNSAGDVRTFINSVTPRALSLVRETWPTAVRQTEQSLQAVGNKYAKALRIDQDLSPKQTRAWRNFVRSRSCPNVEFHIPAPFLPHLKRLRIMLTA
jgi:hypothetical protein